MATEPNEARTATTIIGIDVTRTDSEAQLKGTFTQPPPLVRVKQFTFVQWQLNKVHPNDTFVVSFSNASPFSGNQTTGSPFPKLSAFSDRSAPQLAVNEGNFHYQVFVTDGNTGVVYSINNCPEMDVDGN
jgi:hypothetical protein